MNADVLLSKLEGVRNRGAGQVSARCPAHDDKGPSLSVKELPDGRVLLKCFAGCTVHEVLNAVGLDMAALFPPKPESSNGHTPVQKRRLLSAGQALDMLHDEATVVAVAAAGVSELTDGDIDRVVQAAGRIAYLRSEVMA
jgi:hypothetical protein